MASARIHCFECGRPFAEPPFGTEPKCPHCGALQPFAAIPRGASGGKGGYAQGQRVLVAWGWKWWDARVKRQVGPDRWLIAYDGYESNWDEEVGPDRIAAYSAKRRDSFAPSRSGIAFIAAAVVVVALGLWVRTRRLTRGAGSSTGTPAVSTSGPPPGAPLGAGTAVRPGDAVFVYWNSRWYAAQVLEASSRGGVRIHYVGWSSSWDETATRDRVRVGSAAP